LIIAVSDQMNIPPPRQELGCPVGAPVINDEHIRMKTDHSAKDVLDVLDLVKSWNRNKQTHQNASQGCGPIKTPQAMVEVLPLKGQLRLRRKRFMASIARLGYTATPTFALDRLPIGNRSRPI
jgi:hypothetical protein